MKLAEPRIDIVIEWQNGMVMVFDQFGDQMPEFQGRVEDVRDKIRAVYFGVWDKRNWKEDRDAIRFVNADRTWEGSF